MERLGFLNHLLIALLVLANLAGCSMPRRTEPPIEKLAERKQAPFDLLSSDDSSFVFAGLPKRATNESYLKILRNEAFLVAYDEQRKCPAWVAYRLSGDIQFTNHERLGFNVDERTDARIKHGDYTNSGYDRGHMAPSFGIYSRFGREAQEETYLMSNVCPQTAELNQGRWEEIEAMEAGRTPRPESWAETYSEIWIVTGPIYDSDITELNTGVGVEIPDSFFKIIIDVDEQSGDLHILSFIMPNTDDANLVGRPLEEYLVIVDEIEQLTDNDFFWTLDDETGADLESFEPSNLWPVNPQ